MKNLVLTLIMAIATNCTSAVVANSSSLDRFASLFEEGEYDQALQVLAEIENRTGEFYYQRGVLLGSGLLSTGREVCNAVDDLEKAFELGIVYALPVLNSIYDRSWIAIAAREGSRSALFELHKHHENQQPQDNIFVALGSELHIVEARRALLLSAQLGFEPALEKLEIGHDDFAGDESERLNSSLNFQEIVCEVREY